MKKNGMLQCKICKKQFKEFDQRGFRNAGFTAHQNRCIESRVIQRPTGQESLKKHRLLLPVPAEPLYRPLDARNSGTIGSNLSTERSTFGKLGNSADSQFGTSLSSFVLASSSTTTVFSQDNTIHKEKSPALGQQEVYYPFICCDYCGIDYGLHSGKCIFFYPRPN